ncbi:MAG: hypothetical protein PHO15_03640 [Eubacteriales bacterium]|nr:hypothetical protein [Eubacteriales bacterium]
MNNELDLDALKALCEEAQTALETPFHSLTQHGFDKIANCSKVIPHFIERIERLENCGTFKLLRAEQAKNEQLTAENKSLEYCASWFRKCALDNLIFAGENFEQLEQIEHLASENNVATKGLIDKFRMLAAENAALKERLEAMEADIPRKCFTCIHEGETTYCCKCYDGNTEWQYRGPRKEATE